MMVTIVENQSSILQAVQGSNIWSGQNIQQFNSLAITFSMAHHLYSVGKRYEWVTLSFFLGFLAPLPFWIAHRFTGKRAFSYINTSIILWFSKCINSSFGFNLANSTQWAICSLASTAL